MPLLGEEVLETSLIGKAHGEQFLVALQKIGDGARSDGNVLVLQSLVDFRDRAMLAVAECADEGKYIQTELAMRQGPGALFLRANGLMVAHTSRIGAAHNGQGKSADILKGSDGALGLIEVPQSAAAGRALLADWEQGQRARDRRTSGAAAPPAR